MLAHRGIVAVFHDLLDSGSCLASIKSRVMQLTLLAERYGVHAKYHGAESWLLGGQVDDFLPSPDLDSESDDAGAGGLSVSGAELSAILPDKLAPAARGTGGTRKGTQTRLAFKAVSFICFTLLLGGFASLTT